MIEQMASFFIAETLRKTRKIIVAFVACNKKRSKSSEEARKPYGICISFIVRIIK